MSLEDLMLQYPNNSAEMQVPANSSIVTVNRRINRRLKYISVSIPANCVMTVQNNNLTKLYFANDESGTIEFPNGLDFEDTVITLTNTGSTPARCNYRMIFAGYGE